MNLVLYIGVTCVLICDLVSSDIHQDETQLIKTPESYPQDRHDNLIMSKTSNLVFNRHLPKTIQTSTLAKKLINGMNQGTRMIRQILKRPKMILVPKSKQQSIYRAMPVSSAANHHRFQIKNNLSKFHKKPNQTPIKEEIHHHTYSEEHIHIDEYEDDEPEVKKYKEPMKHTNRHEKDYLKEIEMREEKKVEAAMGHHSSDVSSEIIRGKPYGFDDDWKPIEKPKPASKLNTFVMDQPISKQIHHHRHIIEVEFDNKQQAPTSSSDHNAKPASYSIVNFHNESNAKKEETSEQNASLAKVKPVNPDYFYSTKIKEADYLQSNPSNKVEIKSRGPNTLATQAPLVTTTHRHRPSANYSFRINPMEIPTVSSPTQTVKIETVKQRVVGERKKHRNLVAQTMNRGAKKFGESEQI